MCGRGFFLVDSSYIAVRYVQCGSSGVFVPDPMRLTCIRVQCPPLSAPANATISSSNYFGKVRLKLGHVSLAHVTVAPLQGGSALLKCFDGHLTSDRKTYVTAVCRDDGSWSLDLDQVCTIHGGMDFSLCVTTLSVILIGCVCV